MSLKTKRNRSIERTAPVELTFKWTFPRAGQDSDFALRFLFKDFRGISGFLVVSFEGSILCLCGGELNLDNKERPAKEECSNGAEVMMTR